MSVRYSFSQLSAAGAAVLSMVIFSATGCSWSDRLKPYRIDVRQGNYVSQDMVATLKPGMTRDQVRFALGTPLLVDPFHANRWDYVYRFSPGRGEVELRRLRIYFVDDKLDHVDGDVEAAPSAVSPAASAPAPAPNPKPAEAAQPDPAPKPGGDVKPLPPPVSSPTPTPAN